MGFINVRLITVVCSFSLYSFNLIAGQSVVVRDDIGSGVKSNIVLLLGKEIEDKGITDDSGKISFAKPCERGKQINAAPINPLYYRGYVDCQPEKNQLVVIVTKKLFVLNLKANAKIFEVAGRAGDAALTYSELASRLRKINSKKADRARKSAYLSFAAAINFPNNTPIVRFDKVQGVTVLTRKFVKALKSYQQSNGLVVTGAIDYKTLSTKSNISIGVILTRKLMPTKMK